jgi:hypothetical protein
VVLRVVATQVEAEEVADEAMGVLVVDAKVLFAQ